MRCEPTAHPRHGTPGVVLGRPQSRSFDEMPDGAASLSGFIIKHQTHTNQILNGD
jgi:hypothetical protein